MSRKIDYIILESTNGQIELHRGRGGYDWKGQKGKKLEWILPVCLEEGMKDADSILNKIYASPEWHSVGKGRECSIDSKELRALIWRSVMPHISARDLASVTELGKMTGQERMNKTQSKRRYNDDSDMVSISSDECYTLYRDVKTTVEHFGHAYWKDKTVYMNCDDAGKSAFYIYFYNNFERLGLKKMIATRYDGSDLNFSGSLQEKEWSEFSGYVVYYDGKKELRIPPIGGKYSFHGSYSEKECLDIANNEADVIITNPPFSCFEHYYKCMLSTGKDVICFGAGTSCQHKWTEPLQKSGKMYVLPYELHEFITPTYKKKRALAFVYTTIKQNHTTNSIKPLGEIESKYYDDNGMLIVDKYAPSDYDKPFGVSINQIKNGVLQSGYDLVQCSYTPLVDGKAKFARNIIVRSNSVWNKECE